MARRRRICQRVHLRRKGPVPKAGAVDRGALPRLNGSEESYFTFTEGKCNAGGKVDRAAWADESGWYREAGAFAPVTWGEGFLSCRSGRVSGLEHRAIQ